MDKGKKIISIDEIVKLHEKKGTVLRCGVTTCTRVPAHMIMKWSLSRVVLELKNSTLYEYKTIH